MQSPFGGGKPPASKWDMETPAQQPLLGTLLLINGKPRSHTAQDRLWCKHLRLEYIQGKSQFKWAQQTTLILSSSS